MHKTMMYGLSHYWIKSIKILSLGVLCLSITACTRTDIPIIDPVPSPSPSPSPNVKTVEEANLIMFGDGLLHGAVYKDAYERHGEYYFDDMFDNLKDIISGYDLAFYNQETLLAGEEFGLSSYPQFNGPTGFGDTMMRLGFNLVNLATNHTLDYGERGIIKNLEYWGQQNALSAGSYSNKEDRDTLDIRTINNISYTMLAYTYGTNGIIVPEGKEYLVNVYNEEMLIEDITKARNAVDFLIVSMHWGNEYQHEVSEEQNYFAKLLADLDVNLVIGTHVHVIQPVEWVDDTLIYYGLGNMISAQEGTERLTGAYGSLKIQKNTENDQVNIKIIEPKVDLIYTHYNSAYRNIKLYPYIDLTDDLLNNHNEHYTKFKEILTSLDSSILIGQTK